MTQVIHVFWREFRGYFTSPLAYIFLVVFTALVNFLFFTFHPFFLVDRADARALFEFMPWLLLLFVPAMAMRLWAEERRLGTLEFILTMPLRDGQVVVGKFLASLLFLTIAALLTINVPIAADTLAEKKNGIDWGPVWGGYVGTVLMGAAYLAIGMVASCGTSNQIVAYIVGVVSCFAIYVAGEEFVTRHLWDELTPALTYLGAGAHFSRLLRGVVDTRDVLYYLSVVVFFLYVNVQILDVRRRR